MSIGPIDASTARIAMAKPHDRVEIDGMEVPSVGRTRVNMDVRITESEASDKVGFSDLLTEAVTHAAELGHIAGAKSQAFARGTYDDLHGTMISAKEAEISVKMVGTIRNKLLDAFNELWRINV